MRLTALLATAVCCIVAGPAFAAGTIQKVVITGVEDELMVENINVALTLNDTVGKLVAERAVKAGVTEVVFDRGGFLFHGRVKALADAAREGGLKF